MDLPDGPDGRGDGSTIESGSRLEQLRRRIDDARDRTFDADLLDLLLQDLEAAHEELRVADEEVRTQQDHIDRLVRGNRLLQWQHERVISAFPVPVFTTDRWGKIQSLNAALANLLQVRVDRLLHKPVIAFFSEGDRGLLRDDLVRAQRGDGSFRRVVSVQPRHAATQEVEVFCTGGADEPGLALTWVLQPVREGGPPADEVARALVALTELPGLGVGTDEMIHRSAEICRRALGERAHLSIMIGPVNAPHVVASTSRLAQAFDGAQLRSDEGPCATCYETGAVVVTEDARNDARWPRLGSYVADLPVSSVVTAPVMDGDEVVGTLNVYGARPTEWGPDMATTCSMLAAAIAALHHEVGLKDELQALADDMRTALRTRAVIDQAKGIVMADRHCSADEAFQHLVRLSSIQHVKLRDLAAALVARTVDARYR